jgi:uncharacterized SAM-binding protein YcdF (DUF218 family)
MGTVGRVVSLAVLLLLVYVLVTVAQVTLAARGDGRTATDAIVVMGAAQYDGTPSPALRGRLDHAVQLYREDLAPVVWVTGGRRPGDRFSEASASSRYLIRNGVPDGAVQLEVQGANSYQSLAATARYLRERDQREVLLVSDPWHSYRIKAIAREVGLTARVSPASDMELSASALKRLTYETVAVGVGRIVGYRRLTWLHQRWGSPLQ